MLPPEAIQEFKTLYQNRFGELLSDAEAERIAEKFLSLYSAVYLPPVPRNDNPSDLMSGIKHGG